MGIINSITSWFLRKRIYQIELFTLHPLETQNEVLHSLLHSASDTELGKRFGFSDIDTLDKFRNRVPIRTYEQMYPDIERVLKGERDIIWPGEVIWFSKSSGTTNSNSKFIPVTKESLHDCHYKCGKDMLAIYLHNHAESQLFTGKVLSMGGSHEINRFSENSFYGDLSALLIQNMPIFFEFFRTPAKKTALIPEWDLKIERMSKEVLRDNITCISGVPTWTLVLFQHLFELSGNKDKNLLEIWPNLEVFFHGGVSFKPYRAQFEALIPSEKMTYFETYNASEGFFGLQNESDKDDLLLMLDYGIYYEFVPLEELENEYPQSISLENVALNVIYAMVITTNGGLWRYLIGDTIVFTSKFPFRIKIVGRTKQSINAFGEELMVDNTESAIASASQKTGCAVSNYTVAPVFFSGDETGAHEWLIEFKSEPEDLSYFVSVLDNSLKALNSDYEAKRFKNIALREPVVHVMKEGTFYEWMRKRGKLGGQHKVPRLSESREFVEDILNGFTTG